MKAERVVFLGRVQGVGFRYTVQLACQRSGVGGWVRNREDGAVEAVLQAGPEAVEQALSEVREAQARNLRQVHRTEVDWDPDLVGGFEIRFR